MKLNGWQRLGMVLSTLWLVAVIVIGYGMTHSWFSDWDAWYMLPAAAISERDVPQEQRQELAKRLTDSGRNPVYAYWMANSLTGELFFGIKGVVLFGLLPIVIAWSTAYLYLLAYRWIAAGFKGSTGTNGEG